MKQRMLATFLSLCLLLGLLPTMVLTGAQINRQITMTGQRR